MSCYCLSKSNTKAPHTGDTFEATPLGVVVANWQQKTLSELSQVEVDAVEKSFADARNFIFIRKYSAKKYEAFAFCNNKKEKQQLQRLFYLVLKDFQNLRPFKT